MYTSFEDITRYKHGGVSSDLDAKQCSADRPVDLPRQRIVERVERDGRCDPLHAESFDFVFCEETKTDLLHGMSDDGAVVRHVGLNSCSTARRSSKYVGADEPGLKYV